MTSREKFRPTICLDLDGTIHSYHLGWLDGTVYGTVVPGFFEWASGAKLHFKLAIHSSRFNHIDDDQIAKVHTWLAEQLAIWKAIANAPEGIAEALTIDDFELCSRKPPAVVTIDDRALTFNGDWSDERLTPETLLTFKPWNK